MNFSEWLGSTRELQIGFFGSDPAALEGADFSYYVGWNLHAAHVELAELSQELPIKAWKPQRGRPDEEARARAVEELVDVMHFIANIAVALRVSGEELTEAYERKQEVNRERQRRHRRGA